MLNVFLVRKKPHEPPHDGGPMRWTVPHAIEYFLEKLRQNGEITVMNRSRVVIVTPLPLGNGTDEDCFESDDWEETLAMTQAGAYWYLLRARAGNPSGLVANMRKCAFMARLPDLQACRPKIADWLEQCPLTRIPTAQLRIALMLACDITDVADLDAGLAIPEDQNSPHAALVAALELQRGEHRRGRYPTLRDIITAVAV
ncbi:hypothetical protein HY480_04460 [Candidatus Uhrbacteria bacterium]|nr:hypothetical protein [Candidatus Uhrbacteria bacterium]